MVTTYDPHDAVYTDEADVRDEMTRVFDHCQSCRACVDLCASFPTLFGSLERVDDRDAGRLTPAEQDRVVDLCFQCKLCAVNCPYTPGDHEWAIDFPRLMLRATAMRRANGQRPLRQQVTASALSAATAVGRSGGPGGSLANAFVSAPAGSVRRKLLAATVGVSPVRVLPPFAKQRFSTWFRQRIRDDLTGDGTPDDLGPQQGAAARAIVHASCTVEYHDTQTGKDLVRVYERNRIECSISDAGCCGAPSLRAGDVKRFARVADRNVQVLADEIRRTGGAVVVADPACAHALRRDYLDYCSPARRPDAELVAGHTYDACEYLVDGTVCGAHPIDVDFTGEVAERIVYHQPCHVRAQDIGIPGGELLELTGADVRIVRQCSGNGGSWGLPAGDDVGSLAMAEALAEQIALAGSSGVPGDPDANVAGDCGLANLAIAEQTGRRPSHPLSVIARAYGIPTD